MSNDDSTKRPNILLVTVDSLRADHVYGDKVGTPTFDELRAKGTSYTNAIAQGPFTTFSMPSLFTSRYPSGLHYVEFGGDTVGVTIDEEPTIQTMLGEQGYDTAGFHSNPLLSNLFGFDQGFDVFDSRLPLSGTNVLPGGMKILADKFLRSVRKHPYLPAEKITQRGLEWLDSRSTDRPFFLWLHYMDVHGPYQSKSGSTCLNKYRGEQLWRKAVTSPADVTDEERDRLEAWYREEIVYTDRCIGTLIDGLRDRDVFDDTITVFTADHGEQFGEHGHFSHPHQLYEELVNVPLVIDDPENDGGTIDDVVELVDIPPTIGEMGDVPVPDSFVGHPLSSQQAAEDEPAITEANLVPIYVGGVRTDRWKLIRSTDDEELYDLHEDPTEQSDHSDERPEIRSDLASTLDDHLDTSERAVGSDMSVASAAIEGQETENRLKHLGYLE